MSVQRISDEQSNVSASYDGAATSALDRRDSLPQTPDPLEARHAWRDAGIRLLITLVIFAFGLAVLWLVSTITTPEALDAMTARVAIWRQVTAVLFMVGLGLLVSGVTRYTPLLAVTAFAVSLEPVQDLVEQFINQSWTQVQPGLTTVFVKVTPLTVFMAAIGLYAIAFAVGNMILRPGADDHCLDARPDDVIGSAPATGAARRAGEDRRRRIKSYFSPRPVWPAVAALAAVLLLLFALSAQLSAQEELFLRWAMVIDALFGFSALALLWQHRTRRPMFYLNLFVVLVLMGSHLTNMATGYPYSARGEILRQLNGVRTRWETTHDSSLVPLYENLLHVLGSFYFWYWVALGMLVLAYALVFRFVMYPRWHLATDAEVDATIADDLKPVMMRALRRLGVDRTRLIAEPLNLRGFPDRSVVSNVFVGSWIGDDDRLRFTPQSATVIAFTEEQTLFYETSVDLTTGLLVNETSIEFFYQDVSGVARVSATQVLDLKSLSSFLGRLRNLFSRSEAARTRELKSRSVNDVVQLPGRDLFQITLDSGRALTVVLRDSTFFDLKRKRIVSVLSGAVPSASAPMDRSDTDLPMDENERAMRNVRSMLRDKKRALLTEQR